MNPMPILLAPPASGSPAGANLAEVIHRSLAVYDLLLSARNNRKEIIRSRDGEKTLARV